MAAVPSLDVTRMVRDQLVRIRPDLAVLGEVIEERGRQDEKWGEQNHPDIDPGLAGESPADVARFYGIPTAASAKADTDLAAKYGACSWAWIAVEELAETVEAAAEGDEDAVRAEVLQLAAVCVQWAQAIDRRRGRERAEAAQ